MERGYVFEQIKSALSSVTHQLSIWKLDASDYGVPQRRKRIILVGRQQESNSISPPPPVCEATGSYHLGLAPVVTVSEALDDLPPLKSAQDGENLDYITPPVTAYQCFMRSVISPMQYLQKLHYPQVISL